MIFFVGEIYYPLTHFACWGIIITMFMQTKSTSKFQKYSPLASVDYQVHFWKNYKWLELMNVRKWLGRHWLPTCPVPSAVSCETGPLSCRAGSSPLQRSANNKQIKNIWTCKISEQGKVHYRLGICQSTFSSAVGNTEEKLSFLKQFIKKWNEWMNEWMNEKFIILSTNCFYKW